MHVLFVDDDADLLELYLETFTEFGFTCSAADSATELGSALLNGEPDVIVIDLKMPGIGGIDAIKRLVYSGRLRKAKIIVVSGSIEADPEGQKYLASHHIPWVSKGTQPELLRDAIEKVLLGPQHLGKKTS